MIWIGEKFYKTPADFDREGAELGISRRIAAVPRGFKIGETWVLLAHPLTVKIDKCPDPTCNHPTEAHGPQGCRWDVNCQCEEQPATHLPGIFKVWKPQRIEKILPDTMQKCMVNGPEKTIIVATEVEAISMVAQFKKTGYEKAEWCFLDDEIEKLRKQGITPVFVPADDPDHKGSVYDSDSEEETTENGNGKH
jgi:hypothetical protein